MSATIERCRFAPTTSGEAHPGTLLAALLCWLDARSRGAHLRLRLEDVDPQRCTPERADAMRAALDWFGLDWDSQSLQSEHRAAFETALDRLAAQDLLYPCACSRSRIRAAGLPAVDGGQRYPGDCRARRLPPGGWRACGEALRLRLPAGRIEIRDESGLDLGQDPAQALGDPVLRRADGAFAYHLAVVVDDADEGITRIVRGRDLAPSCAVQRVLQRALGYPEPIYRHHFLLLEEQGGKFAKLHGAVGWRELGAQSTPEQLCGRLAGFAGLNERAAPVRPAELIGAFDWRRVRTQDLALRWTGRELVALP